MGGYIGRIVEQAQEKPFEHLCHAAYIEFNRYKTIRRRSKACSLTASLETVV